MLKQKTTSQMSVEELIQEALQRERDLLEFYIEILPSVGYESMTLITCLCEQQKERIARLRNLLTEIHELRELTSAIAD
jgi:hypothetical protein